MISKDELDKTILELEMRDTTFANCAKLADLYTVRDHLTGQQTAQPTPLSVNQSSEFLRYVYGKDSVAVWDVMGELMDTLKVTAPRAYSGVMERILSLQ